MDTVYSGKRKSGIPLIGDIPWGTHFSEFYSTKKDLLDILVPYFKAGLESNELCIWITSGPLGSDDARRAMEEAMPHFGDHAGKRQMEIISHGQWQAKGGGFEKTVVSRLDNVISGGFDGLRLACSAYPGKKGSKAISFDGADVIADYNVIAVFTYPRDEFDAIGLMDVVKKHRFALVHNAGRWEVIESAEATIEKGALRRSEEKLRSLFSHMGEGFAYHRVVLDGTGEPCDYVFLEVNDAFEGLTGLKRENIIGKRATEVFPGLEEDSTDLIRKYGEVALTGKPVRFESYSGPLSRWYSISAFSPHKGFFAVTFSDITERKNAERELLEAKAEWERTFDSVPDLISILDNQHRIVRANLALANRLGMTPEQCIGLRCHDVVHGTHEAPAFCPLTVTCQDGQQHVVEVHEPRLGGDLLISTTPLRDAKGHLVGAVHVARDVTDLKMAEKTLKQRTIELEAANKELEAFSYSVSHDLRAPLRSISGFTEALLEDYGGKLDDQGKQYLGYVQESSQVMAQLIDDLLKLSRVMRGDMHLANVDLSRLARSIMAKLANGEPRREVSFVVAPHLMCQGDEHLLRVLLENLLSNAWKFTGKTPLPQIEVGVVEEGGQRAYFVRDNGAGFDMTYADKLFQPFQRLHRSDQFAGTGIGLATVQRIVHRHGGQVWADGKVGEGATFYFTLGHS